ncbi:MAG TPA: helix-turn-helix transcriptional regulator [Ktedonobacteraceae bacterium]|nr:helix-turn-helix transcriptional regulator [Ktedonobacteraceae bacterium]
MQVEKFHLGEYLRRVRENQNLGIRELAKRAQSSEGKSVTAAQISNIEKKKSNPGFETLQRIAELLDVPLVFILDGDKGATDTVTIVSNDKIARALLEVPNREKLVQLLTFCLELNDEQIEAILKVAQAIRNFTRTGKNAIE